LAKAAAALRRGLSDVAIQETFCLADIDAVQPVSLVSVTTRGAALRSAAAAATDLRRLRVLSLIADQVGEGAAVVGQDAWRLCEITAFAARTVPIGVIRPDGFLPVNSHRFAGDELCVWC
jgi:hypothetical protein